MTKQFITMRLDAEDLERCERLRERHGLRTRTDAIRYALARAVDPFQSKPEVAEESKPAPTTLAPDIFITISDRGVERQVSRRTCCALVRRTISKGEPEAHGQQCPLRLTGYVT